MMGADNLTKSGCMRSVGPVAQSELAMSTGFEGISGLADTTANKVAATLNTIEDRLSPAKLGNLTAERLSHLQVLLREDGRTEATIASHLRHIKAALNWAKDAGMLSTVPTIRMPKRAKAQKMKGRPIVLEEFERMLAAVPRVVLDHRRREVPEDDWRDHERERIESWRAFLRGIWWSGLRLSESLDLWWDRDDRLSVDLSESLPMLRIAAGAEKGHQDRLLPLAPEAAEMLLATPEGLRTGRVFNPTATRQKRDRLNTEAVSRIGTAIGKAANVKVASKMKNGEPSVKWASCHDLRRSFGFRWAMRVMPAVLQQLMRHESIETTMKYYVGRDAQSTAAVLWETVGGNTLGNTPENSAEAVSANC